MRFGLLLTALCAVALGAEPRLGRAIELPAQAQALRDQGVPAGEVASAVRASREHGLSAADTADVLEAADEGKLDNLGSFVKEKLGEGLRGRELAKAIHEEQARRGTGKPDDRGPPDGHGPDHDKGGKAPDEGEKGGKGPDDGEKGGKGKSGKGGH